MTGRCLVGTLALSLACAAIAREPAAGQISGTATYRERLALPTDAVFDATLEEVSRAGTAGTVLGRARIQRPRSRPIRFEIPFDADRIEPARSYVVRARILVGGRPFLTSERSYPVLTRGNGRQVALVLRSAESDLTESSAGSVDDGSVGEGTRSGSRGEGTAGGGSLGGPIGTGSAIFTGELPCSDCASVRHQLELFGDESFFLRRTYLGKGRNAVVDEIGTWSLSRDRSTLTLTGGGEAPLRIAIGRPNTLHVLGERGASASSSRTNTLRLSTRAQPLEPRLRMRGMYRYMADAGRFMECVTRQSWPVAQERENAALESAYSRMRRGRGAEVLVEVEGRVALRPRVEGEGRERTLVVERVVGVRPGDRCGSSTQNEPLENTRWRLTRLGDKAVSSDATQREPQLVLSSETGRVSGSGGCNQLSGRYEAEDGSLTFSTLATTRRACPSGMDVERRFLAALRATSRAEITQQRLELYDDDGRLLARLEARQPN
ncbi:MAG TPA: META domain-containing protein [Gemmatimonadaceae bacterium]|nr:META domain-containing protein [Gemmatimonadaceae bacterium]